MLADTEIDDFNKSLKDHGYQEDDFEIIPGKSEYVQTGGLSTGGSIGDVSEEITVKRKSTGKEKKYVHSNGRSWNGEFEKDLSSGCYD